MTIDLLVLKNPVQPSIMLSVVKHEMHLVNWSIRFLTSNHSKFCHSNILYRINCLKGIVPSGKR